SFAPAQAGRIDQPSSTAAYTYETACGTARLELARGAAGESLLIRGRFPRRRGRPHLRGVFEAGGERPVEDGVVRRLHPGVPRIWRRVPAISARRDRWPGVSRGGDAARPVELRGRF